MQRQKWSSDMRGVCKIGVLVSLAAAGGLWSVVCCLFLANAVSLVLAPWGVPPVTVLLVTPVRILAFLIVTALTLFALGAFQLQRDDKDEAASRPVSTDNLRALLDEAIRWDRKDA